MKALWNKLERAGELIMAETRLPQTSTDQEAPDPATSPTSAPALAPPAPLQTTDLDPPKTPQDGAITPQDGYKTPQEARTKTPESKSSPGGSDTATETSRHPHTHDQSGTRDTPPPSTPVSGSLPHIASRDSIRRKPVPVTSYDSSQTLREMANMAADENRQSSAGGVSTPRNPLEKTTVLLVPEQLGSKGGTPNDSTPRTHITLPKRSPLRNKMAGDGKKGRIARLKEVNGKKLWGDWWVEIAFVGVAILCLILIFAILGAFNNHPLPLPLNLNAFLSFFATLFVASLLIPLTHSIAQWKWNYFSSEDRSLADFQTFDTGSRSPFGAALLLAKLRHKHIASVGAVIFIIGLLTPAISQLAISYDEVLVPKGNGGAVINVRTLLGADDGGVFEQAATKGFETGSDPYKSVSPVCPGGQCQFPTFSALAICTRATSITPLLKVEAPPKSSENNTNSNNDEGKSKSVRRAAGAYNASLPRDANCRLETDAPYAVLVCKTSGGETLSFREDDDAEMRKAAVYSMPIIYSNPRDSGNETGKVDFEAVEILFYLCTQTYDVKVEGGAPLVTVGSSSVSVADGSADREVDVRCTMPVANGTAGSAMRCEGSKDIPKDAFMVLKGQENGGDVELKAHFKALESLAMAINKGTSGLWTKSVDNKEAAIGADSVARWNDVLYSGDQDTVQQGDRVAKMMEGLSGSLSSALLAQSSSSTQDGTTPITGTSLTPQTVATICWGALSLLIIHLIAVLAFLLATALLTNTARTEVLKASALAMLFALEDECRAVAGHLESIGGMRRKARVMRVRLRGDAMVFTGDSPRRGSEVEQPGGEEVARHEHSDEEKAEEERKATGEGVGDEKEEVAGNVQEVESRDEEGMEDGRTKEEAG